MGFLLHRGFSGPANASRFLLLLLSLVRGGGERALARNGRLSHCGLKIPTNENLDMQQRPEEVTNRDRRLEDPLPPTDEMRLVA